ncbi:MAG: IS66 family transposase, partial [Planctomycetota bacterium]
RRTARPAIAQDELDWLTQHAFDQCPCCGGPVTTDTENPVSRVQQIEIVSRTETTEHQSLASHCAACEKTFVCKIPPEVRKAGLCGVELSSLIGFLKGACHASLSTIRKYLIDVHDLRLSRGQLAKIIDKVSQAIAPLYEDLLGSLKAQRILNIDETGHRDNGKRMWTWCFRGSGFTVFKIDPSRGSGVLLNVLGEEFNGIIGCDYFSAYHKYRGLTDCSIQFCFAHLIRDLRFLKDHSTGRTHGWSSRLLDAIGEMFGVIHLREELGNRFDGELEDAAMEVLTRARFRVPDDKQARNLSKRFENDGESYLKFLTTPGLEPTNNIAEQAIRFVVIDRKVTQGSKSESGQRWLERIWTLMATCSDQNRSPLDIIRSSRQHFFRGERPPPLLSTAQQTN